MRMLIAGASGAIGWRVLLLARENGYFTRALCRMERSGRRLQGIADEVIVADAATAALPDVADRIDIVVSCLGASVAASGAERRSYRAVDQAANLRLIERAVAARVRQFIYVSVFADPGCAATAYVQAHEAVVAQLKRSGLDAVVIRPTPLFTAFEPLVAMARRGVVPLIGDGSARTNPVHPQDVAEVIQRQWGGGAEELLVGGPEVLTRRQIAGLAFRAIGRKARLLRLPAAAVRAASKLALRWNPRLGEWLEFAAAFSVSECVAPKVGRRELGDYLMHHASS